MARPAAAFFCMPDRGHFHRLRSLISGLSSRGLEAFVFTDPRLRAEVEGLGGVFIDLSQYSVEAADAESWPYPVRFVTFAARYAERIIDDVRAVNPRVVIHDTFAVIATVVANRLGIPRVNVCAGHNVAPDRFLPILEAHPRLRISTECWRAVDTLRTRYGLPDASPFSYVTNFSSALNVYCEPPAFLDPADRTPFEPLAFYGSVAPPENGDRQGGAPCFGPRQAGALHLYVAFGTAIWAYREAEALSALAAIAGAVSRRRNVRAVISVGGADLSLDQRAALARPRVSVETYVDQWRILREADVFVTHHGLNSTHESIFHRVPMISYPFVWDQPQQAATCQRFGLALPLVPEVMGPVTTADVDAVLDRLCHDKDVFETTLSTARQWELAVIADRPAVLQRIVDLQ